MYRRLKWPVLLVCALCGGVVGTHSTTTLCTLVCPTEINIKHGGCTLRLRNSTTIVAYFACKRTFQTQGKYITTKS